VKAETYKRHRQKSQEAYNIHQGSNTLQLQSKPEVPTQNFFAPLRSIEMAVDHGDDADGATERQQHQEPSNQAGRPPPVVLTSQVNLIQLQRLLKGLLKGSFEFHNIRSGITVFMKEMVDFSAIRSHFESNKLP
jgi:hypothetical protein